MATYRNRRSTRGKNPYSGADILKVRRRVFPRESIWPRVIAVSLLCIFVVIGSFVFSLLWSVETARMKASSAVDCAGEFLSAAKDGDRELLEQSAYGVSSAAHGIRDELNGSIWELVTTLPVVGTDIQNIRVLSDVLIDFSDNALIPMAESGNVLALKDFAKGDSINFAALPGLLAALDEAMPALNRSARTLEAMPPSVMSPIQSAVSYAKQKIVMADSFLTRVRPLFPYLPELLGSEGERHYLILAENNAEIHAIGGFVGALGILTVSNGTIEMGDFEDLPTVLAHDGDSAGATQEEITVFGERCDTHHGDHNIIPDFSRVGQLYFNSWNVYQDYEVDGVFAFDVVFLQYLLDAFGPIETSSGVTVDGTNCAAILLNQSLFWWAPTECDVFYREVASKALSMLLGNLDDIELSKFIAAVSTGVDEDRCSIWMRDEEVEDVLKATGFARELKHDPAKPVLGVYISDYSISKMSYYLSSDITISEPVVNDDGSQSYDVSVVYTNNFDPDARDYFPSYIAVGRPEASRSECDLIEDVRILAPEGGRIEGLTSQRLNTRIEGPQDNSWKEYTYQGIDVMAAMFRIDAGESVQIDFTVVTSPAAVDDLTIRKTPLMPPEIAYWNVDIADSHPEWNLEKTV